MRRINEGRALVCGDKEKPRRLKPPPRDFAGITEAARPTSRADASPVQGPVMGQSQDTNPDDERWAAAIGRAMNAGAPAAGGDLSVGAEALTEDATAHQPMGGTSDAGGMIGGYRLLE